MKRIQAVTLPCILSFISPLLYGQRFSEKTEYPIGIMGGFSGFSAPFLIQQNDELQRVLEKTRPILLNPDTEKLERSIDSDHDYPGYSSHYKDPKFEALQKTSQAITEQIDTLHEDVLRESDGSNPDFKPVFDTEFVDDEISQTTNSSWPSPETQDTATRYFNAALINQCPDGTEGEGDSEGDSDSDCDCNNSESGTEEPDIETASPADGPEVNYAQVSLEVLSDIAQADTSGCWDQFAADIDPDTLKKLNTQEQLLHAFSHSVNSQFPNLVSVAPIQGMLAALSPLLKHHPRLTQNILAASVRAFSAAAHRSESHEQKTQVAPDLMSRFAALIQNILAAIARAFGTTAQRSESHGLKIQVTPDLLSKLVANPAAITEIPESILKRLAPHMKYHTEHPVDIPEGSSNNDIVLPEAGGYIKSLPSGCYSFKHHPINFIIPEHQGEGSDYLIYLAGSHLFLKTKSKDAMENFVKIAVESWNTEYKGIIQYNPVCDLDTIELGPRLGEGSIPDRKSKYAGCIAGEQNALKENCVEGEIIVLFDNFASIKEMDQIIRSLPNVIELDHPTYMDSEFRMHLYTVEKGEEKKLVPLMYDVEGVDSVEINRRMRIQDCRHF